MPALSVRAGPEALRILRERGLRVEDVDVVPGASGGPKWLVLAALDRFLFADFFQRRDSSAAPRRPLQLIGSSIGSWRLACLAQRDPAAALERGHRAYIEQRYPRNPPASLVTQVSAAILDALLGRAGVDEILSHPWARLHVVTTECRGIVATERPALQLAGFAIAAGANLLARRTLGWRMRRTVFHAGPGATGFAHLADLPTTHRPLTRENLRAALLASASIPRLLEGVRIPDADGIHRDGGIIDYHLDLDFGEGDGIVLYPHFYPHIVPGWFDKALRWRRANGRNFGRAVLLAPSAEFVARLPHGKIPDRRDFWRFSDEDRIRYWRSVVAASQELADDLQELLATGRLADRAQPLG